MLVKLGIFPQVGVKIKNVGNHHLVNHWHLVTKKCTTACSCQQPVSSFFFFSMQETMSHVPVQLSVLNSCISPFLRSNPLIVHSPHLATRPLHQGLWVFAAQLLQRPDWPNKYLQSYHLWVHHEKYCPLLIDPHKVLVMQQPQDS